jgi:DNA-binding CsgD family transcriptional regulator
MGELAVLGLTAEQERVYTVLATTALRRTADLADAAELTAAETEHVLERLLRLGLAVSYPGDEPSYSVAPVELSVQALVRAKQEALLRAQAYAGELAQRALRTNEVERPEQLVSVVVGREAMGRISQQLQASASEEVLSFDRPPYYAPYSEGGAGYDPEQAVRLESGLRYRTVFDQALLDDPGVVARIRRDALAGEEGRVLADLPLKLIIVDRKSAILPLMDDASSEQPAALLIRPSVLVDSLVALFEALWRVAAPLRLDVPEQEQAQEEQELRTVVSLLAAGLTDTRIAHTLGVSERTVRRKIAAALENLGVQTRFQAGMRAHERGWV